MSRMPATGFPISAQSVISHNLLLGQKRADQHMCFQMHGSQFTTQAADFPAQLANSEWRGAALGEQSIQGMFMLQNFPPQCRCRRLHGLFNGSDGGHLAGRHLYYGRHLAQKQGTGIVVQLRALGKAHALAIFIIIDVFCQQRLNGPILLSGIWLMIGSRLRTGKLQENRKPHHHYRENPEFLQDVSNFECTRLLQNVKYGDNHLSVHGFAIIH